MANIDLITCPGCHLRLPNQQLAAMDRFHASGECWELYGELSAYNLGRNDLNFTHQTCVDAYGAQHAGGQSKPITTVFSLVGLCLANEHGYTGRKVQQAHMALSKGAKTWTHLEPPSQVSEITVLDVLRATGDEEREAMIHQWAQSVWKSWESQHDFIRSICSKLI